MNRRDEKLKKRKVSKKKICTKCRKVISQNKTVLVLESEEFNEFKQFLKSVGEKVFDTDQAFCSQECYDLWEYECRYGSVPNDFFEKIDSLLVKNYEKHNSD